jgi:hypothetical protein
MLYTAKVAVCSDSDTEHINALFGHNVEFLSVEPGGTLGCKTSSLASLELGMGSLQLTATLVLKFSGSC